MASRRGFLQNSALLATTGAAGCTLDLNPTSSGSLVIDNEQDTSHAVAVTVSKTSKEDGSIPSSSSDKTPTSTSTPVWKRKDTFQIGANGHIGKSGYISEQGTFYIKVELDNGKVASHWYDFWAGGDNGNQIAGGYISINITTDGRVYMSRPVDS